MPIKISDQLPAFQILREEGFGCISATGTFPSQLEPLKVGIMNLMPTKIVTETQILRLLNNSPLPVEISLLRPAAHVSKNTPLEHLLQFYKTFDQVKGEFFDGLIITGAPVEKLPFEQVDYWGELCQIMDWEETHVRSTFYVCWGAQAGLYHKFGIPKYPLPAKMFGVFPHKLHHREMKLLRGFDDIIYAPHSRHTEIRRSDLEKVPDILILSESDEAGMYMVMGKDERHIFITGHSEYDPLTLKAEYDRDVKKGLPITIPRNYYPNDDPSQTPAVRWRGHANQLFTNWLHYYVNSAKNI